MTIKIEEKEYKLKQTIRAIFLWEQISERQFEIKTTLDNYLYFYCILLANNPDSFTYDWNGFLDLLDENPGLLFELSHALTKEAEMEKLLNPDKGQPDADKKKD